MRSILILFSLLLCVASLSAQNPQPIKLSYFQGNTHNAVVSTPENACNAGTFNFGTHTGQSNDVAGEPIYLCKDDAIQLIGNNDAMFMDPQPGTAPGVGYALYKCSPTVGSGALSDIIADPCVLNTPPAMDGLWIVKGQANGSMTFTNNGNIITNFNAGNPVQVWFAPITLDDFANGVYEQAATGQPLGPCTNANLAEKFSVVYLNEITIDGINPNNGNDCIGKFRVKGGLPEFQNSSKYTIDIALQSNNSVKGLIHNPSNQWNHSASILFSVTVPGVYEITVTDAKSCKSSVATINMNTCNPTDNVILNIPNISAPVGSNVCVPITATNFTDISAFGVNFSWDPTVLQYTTVQNPNPTMVGFMNSNNLNALNAAQGYLNVNYFNASATNLTIPTGGNFVDVCFDVIGANGICSAIQAAPLPGVVDFTNATGMPLGLTVNAGSVCIGSTPLSVTAVPNNTCNANGSVLITVNGGNAPYDITYIGPNGSSSGSGNINTPGSSFTPSGLDEGDYTIIVFDNLGVSDTAFATLNINSLGVNIDFTEPTCSGAANGSVTAKVIFNNVTVNNPGSNYTFTWNPAVSGNPQTLNNVGSGTYQVTVTNVVEGCTAVASGTLSEPAPISQASLNVIPASCLGVSNGSISILATGGVALTGGDYKFNWAYSITQAGTKTPLPTLTSTTNPVNVNMLQVGFYHVTITDANMCTMTDVIEIVADKEVSFDPFTITDASCFGSKDGEINVQYSTNPVGPVNVATWDYMPKPVGSTAVPGTSSYVINNLPSGDYIVSATDADGCMMKDTFEVNQPTAIDIQPQTLINPTCMGVNDGSISIKPPSGGVPPFTFEWRKLGVIVGSTQNLNNIEEGDYIVTVSDGNGCTSTKTFTISLPAPPNFNGIDSTSVKCGADGCLKVKTTSTNISYLWVNLTTSTTIGNTAEVCNLAGGEYAFVMTNADQCVYADTLTLGSVDGMFFLDTNYQQPSCFGLDDGFMAITVKGGTMPYSYDWDLIQSNTALAFNISSGTYKVTVTDNNDCTLEGEFFLPDPPAITFAFNSIQGTSCNNTCDGEVSVTAEYATVPPTAGNFTFTWDDQPGIDAPNRTNLCGGLANVTIRDDNNCFVLGELVISSPPPVIADTFYTIPATCDGESNGSATVSGGGGNGGGYTFDWGGNFPMDATITGLASGQYTVTIFDNIGCTGTKTLVVLEPDPIAPSVDTLATNDVDCNGRASGQIGLQVSGGNVGVFSFLWTDGTDTVGNTGFVDQLLAGNYFVTVTDSKGCTGTAGPITLLEPPPVEGSYLEWQPLVCFGDQTTVNVDTVWGGVGGPFQFSVDYGVALDVDFPVSVGGGVHVVSYFDRLGCSTEDSIFIIEPEEIMVNFNPAEVEIELGDTLFQLQPIITGAAVDSFIWAPSVDLSDPLSLRPYAGNFETTTFTLVVFDQNGCSGTGSILVAVDPNRNVYLPNIFKPGNASGLNDRFNPLIGNGVEKVNFMRIYDRWGEMLFERESFVPQNDDFSEGWDGKHNGKRVVPGVYVYIVEVSFLDGRVLLYRGDVTVVN
jgi:hypothetical protein